jgi:TorA maturation chaperone TorD
MSATAQKVAFDAPRAVSAEDQVRADYYALLSHLLNAAPDDRLLQAIVIAAEPQSQSQPGSALGAAWRSLAVAAAVVDHEAVEEEFDRLFGGVGRPEVMLFGSYYLAGFMHEKPLAQLRADLAALGLGRGEGVSATEDHLAALCEVMRFLILGDLNTKPASVPEQKRFFSTHIEPWVRQCCASIQGSDKANFYKRVAAFADAFFAIEIEAFDME